jgi:hypothetical protein
VNASSRLVRAFDPSAAQSAPGDVLPGPGNLAGDVAGVVDVAEERLTAATLRYQFVSSL